MAGSACATCKFFGITQNTRGQQLHICRRNPPVVHAQFFPTQEGQMVDATNTYWPTINAGDWCGEHQVAIVLAS
jgi:hypothetical protein